MESVLVYLCSTGDKSIILLLKDFKNECLPRILLYVPILSTVNDIGDLFLHPLYIQFEESNCRLYTNELFIGSIL